MFTIDNMMIKMNTGQPMVAATDKKGRRGGMEGPPLIKDKYSAKDKYTL